LDIIGSRISVFFGGGAFLVFSFLEHGEITKITLVLKQIFLSLGVLASFELYFFFNFIWGQRCFGIYKKIF
jgi:hypothetical protein